MNNRLGGKISKEKTRPKSTERTKSLKGKSSDVVDDNIVTDEMETIVVDNDGIDEKIEEFRINREFLHSNHSPQPPTDKLKESIIIRKVKPTSKLLQNKPKERVYVAKQVHTKEETDTITALSQCSVDIPDNVKPHSILGSVGDFTRQAAKERQIQLLSAKSCFNSDSVTFENQKNDRVSSGKSNDTHIDETKALDNWNRQMKERQRQQHYLSKQMDVGKDMLVMNQSDAYRSIQEERTLIDRAMPSKDYGKGYRVGSEFWRQVEGVGSDDGISITLGETEKGNTVPIEHIGCPSKIKDEMGTGWMETSRVTNIHKPWQKSDYLQERKTYFKDVIDEMDPHKPYIEGLEVVGHALTLNSISCVNLEEESEASDDMEQKAAQDLEETEKYDPLSQFEDVIAPPIFGPSLLINGQSARWEGGNINNNTEIGLTVQLLFEAEVGQIGNGFIDITNDGTTSIHYQWKKQPLYDPFGLKKGKQLQRFYFDVCDGIILPNVTVNVPFIFKSPNAGIFNEIWHLETHPTLCAGRTIEIILHGISTKEDEYKEERKEIEEIYQLRQNKTMVERIIAEVLSGIKTPPRPSTPLENYITEEEIFSNQNDNNNFQYNTDTAKKLKEFFLELNPDENWDLSINTIQKNIVEMEEEEKERALQKLNEELKSFNNSSGSLVEKNVYDQCYQILCESVDKFVIKSIALRESLGMPEKELIVKQDVMTASKKGKKGVGGIVEVQKTLRTESRSPKKETPTGKSKTPNKEKGKETPSNIVKEIIVNEPEEIHVSLSLDMKHPSYSKYMEKMYGQVYYCLQEMANNVDAIMSFQK